ncbi:hypothetical protein Lesp02_71530 [Lentzea sp. NBRC 105346]|uniref:single-stranded DNA-binding protein n=1 Tax=Lentzea sp. NBRC 105346 TaxID=3032205 RepID=UPI0024A3F512|nr:single-stranded DNA-binding protein [Lentzea sp. NBRC 105346]GLZ34966.1 hypothetical protein Lesp02_71530 [Lentzea sp. NBRC 105346]
MPWNETPVTIVGTVITDVVHRQVGDGSISLANFRIVSTERRYNRETSEWVDGDQLFLGVTCWRRMADNARATLAKGDPVVVHGRLRQKSSEADGVRRQFYEIEATAMGVDLSRCRSLGSMPEIVAPRTEEESVAAAGAEPQLTPF